MSTSTCKLIVLKVLIERSCLSPVTLPSLPHPEAAGGPPGRGHGGVPHGGGWGGHLDRLQLWFHSAPFPHRDPGALAGH